jgi:nitroreductase
MKNRGVTMKPLQAKQAHCHHCGAFQDKAVSEEHLKKIVRAGLDAPSRRDRQISEIVAITDPQKLAAIRAILPGQVFIATASAFIAAIFEVRIQPVSVYAHTSEVEDNAAIAHDLLRAITALGYASVWLDSLLRFESRAQRIGDVMDLPTYQRVRVLLPVGVAAAASTRRQRRSFRERHRSAQSG